MAVSIGVSLGVLAFYFFAIQMFQRLTSSLNNHRHYGYDAINFENISLLISISSLIIYILSYVFLLMWFHRAYYNLHRLNAPNLFKTSSWAAWSWFVPIVNLYWPYKIMMDIWTKSREQVGEKPFDTEVVGYWWGLIIFQKLITWVYYYNLLSSLDTKDMITSLILGSVVLIIGITATAIFYYILKKASIFESELLDKGERKADDTINLEF